jgi:hypothetical protein
MSSSEHLDYSEVTRSRVGGAPGEFLSAGPRRAGRQLLSTAPRHSRLQADLESRRPGSELSTVVAIIKTNAAMFDFR